MKYRVKSEIVSSKVQEVEVDLPLGVKNDVLADQMVRMQTRKSPGSLVKLEEGETIVEVWRGDTRVFPRAAKRSKVKENKPPVSPKDWVEKAEEEEGA